MRLSPDGKDHSRHSHGLPKVTSDVAGFMTFFYNANKLSSWAKWGEAECSRKLAVSEVEGDPMHPNTRTGSKGNFYPSCNFFFLCASVVKCLSCVRCALCTSLGKRSSCVLRDLAVTG